MDYGDDTFPGLLAFGQKKSAVREKLARAIIAASGGAQRLRAELQPDDATGTTVGVAFDTVKDCWTTDPAKCHFNIVPQDSDLGALPGRDARAFAGARLRPRLIIDGTERRRQRPKSPEKQAMHYSGRKKAHSDKNVVVVEAGSRRVNFLSGTYAGCAADKGIADREGIAFPPGTALYQDGGFQGYEPAAARTRQAKKN